MKLKVLITLIMMIAVLFAGCTDDQPAEETPTGEVNETPADNQSESADNQSVTESEDVVETPGDAYEPMDYLIRLRSYNAIPRSLEINRTDTVTWINQQDPSKFFTITSGEDLWEPTRIGLQHKFTYQFNETGVYTAYVPPWNGMNVTITVK